MWKRLYQSQNPGEELEKMGLASAGKECVMEFLVKGGFFDSVLAPTECELPNDVCSTSIRPVSLWLVSNE